MGPAPVVLTGANGSGKTNLLEALSLLTSGQGLRRAPYPELARMGQPSWAVAARLVTPLGRRRSSAPGSAPRVGRAAAAAASCASTGRRSRAPAHSAEHVEMVWLTPAMDGLFTGPASDRRRFLDRLIAGLDPSYRPLLGQFERAMQQRNRLLAEDVREAARFEGFERIMAGDRRGRCRRARHGRRRAFGGDRCAPATPAHGALFPWAELALVGTLEAGLAARPAVDVEDDYVRQLARERERDRAAGRTLDGPHRSDLDRRARPQGDAGQGVLDGRAEGAADRSRAGPLRPRRASAATALAPVLLLDEIAAHLDPLRRAALFEEIVALGSQAWMSGTDPEAFAALAESGPIPPRRGGPRRRPLPVTARNRTS